MEGSTQALKSAPQDPGAPHAHADPPLEAIPRPVFYLPVTEGDATSASEDFEEQDLSLNNGFLLQQSQKGFERPITRESPSPSPPNGGSTAGLSPRSDIRDQIRHCLARVRTRSTHLSTVSSFEAGLYHLEGLLQEDSPFQEEAECRSDSFALQWRPGLSGPTRTRLHSAKPTLQDASTITDVCTGENVAEVEVISLVEEQIPQYKLRADTYTEFSGVDKEGWCGIPFPALKAEEVQSLSPEQAEGALAYFVLCGNRVSQMTRTYNDIDAVTRLLEEKEKDLELAAKIGQQLLARNRSLEERQAALEAELSAANDEITQLRHDLQMKTDLLQIYTNDVDDSCSESTPTALRHISVDLLERKVRNLEDENTSLRQEASQLAFDTQSCEDREKELVHDVIKQLNDANLHVHQLNEELGRKTEDSLRQQEDITQLLAQVVELQARSKRLVLENEELGGMVGVARECQQELTTELAELKERYAEVLDLLHDSKEQLRAFHKKNLPGSRGTHLTNIFNSPFRASTDSIASELNSLSSIGEELGGVDDSSLNRVFDTVRLSSTSQSSLHSFVYGGSLHSTPTRHSDSYLTPAPKMSSSCKTHLDGASQAMLDSGIDSDTSLYTDSEDGYPASCPGVPGWPGTPDLSSCIRRLGPGSQTLAYSSRTPDSIMATGTSRAHWTMPKKLQIVKPMEGSLTLHQWSRLATPHLGGLLEDREGVAIKGGVSSNLNLNVYSLSDLEEDEDFPGKQFESTSGVFTFTDSTVMHPDDVNPTTLSLQASQMSARQQQHSGSGKSSPATPHSSLPPSRRGSTATFSTNVGLAKVLHERGLAEDAHALRRPTATPANSPNSSQPPSPIGRSFSFQSLQKTLCYGAEMLRKTFYRDARSPPLCLECPADLNLVEKVQTVGVHSLMAPPSAFTVGGVITSRPQTISPLLHLSKLIRTGAKTSSVATVTSPVGTKAVSSSPIRTPSPGERRPIMPPGAPLGIPGRPGAGHLEDRLGQLKPGQRADLGTVSGRPRPQALGTVPGKNQKMGSVGWTSLGRKGGFL